MMRLEAVTVVEEIREINDHQVHSSPAVTSEMVALLLAMIMALLVWMVVNAPVYAR